MNPSEFDVMIRKWLMKMGVLILGVAVLMPVVAEANHIPTVGLGKAVSFAVLSGQGVTNTGPSVIKGDIGSHPNPAVTGFPPGGVQNGTINPSYTAGAKDALVTAYNDSAGRTPVTTIGTELGGKTLNHGIHDAQTGTFGITGTLTLDAQGDPSAVWIFKMAATLITGSSSNVNLINGASECNIFWQVGSSATLGPSSTLRGTVMALTSITLTTNATLFGRALARNGTVTLDSNIVDASPCPTAPRSASASPSASPSASASSSPSDSASASPSPSDGPATSVTKPRGGPPWGPRLPYTGGWLPIGQSIAIGFGLILIGVLLSLRSSST